MRKKPKDISFKNVIGNNLNILKMIFKFSPMAFPTYLAVALIRVCGYFISGTYILNYVVSSFEVNKRFEELLIGIVILVIGAKFFTFFETMMNSLFSPHFNAKIEKGVKRALFEKSRDVELSCYENPQFYDKYVKAAENILDDLMSIMMNIINFFASVLSLVLYGAFLFTIDPVFIIFAFVPLLTTFVRRISSNLSYKHGVEDKIMNRRRHYAQRVFYMGEFAKEVRLTDAKNFMLKYYDEACEGRIDIVRKYGKAEVSCSIFLDSFVDVILNPLALIYAAYRTFVTGDMSIAECVVIINSIGSITNSLTSFLNQFQTARTHAMFVNDYNTFMNYDIGIKSGEKHPTPTTLELKNISFSYEGSDKKVLNNVSITVRPGEKIALVGHNGAGKSTLVKLILRLYDPTEGEISLDGDNIKQLKLKEYRDMFATVFQDCKPVALSVKENVVMGPASDIDDEKVIEALKKADVYEKICTLPEGINTPLTKEFYEHGAVFSGGESQKLSLAHAFYKNSPFIVLDEPTSAMDPIAEYKMYERMAQASENKGVIFISHRLSSAVVADRIYMLENDEVIESGSHRELMMLDGKYADMFRKQAENYIEGGNE
ncbi:MAG: ABC transporter ATP-binding protein [Clostridia bacterium]|nr:ABC transporter ATP-binding protein [Clostridia bacterium]